MSNEYSYPFDPTGTSPGNKITGEQQILTIINEKHYSRIIPRWAPFFHQGLRLRIRLPNGVVRDMVEGEDYYLGNQFRQATKATAKPIYGSINIIDRTLQGTIMLDTYQTLGGMWTIDETEIAEILANQLYNPRIVTWEQVVEVPAMFPVINHEWDLVDLTGMSDVSQKLSEIAFTIANSGDSGLLVHIADDQNPHKVTKAQVGLGLVQNHGIATKAQAEAGSVNTAYMTPLRVSEAIERRVVDLRAHLLNYENPHNTTKAQVGLGDVVNLPLASQVHAEEGQSNAHYMTPLRVKNAIDLQMGTLDLHINDLTNPHQVNKVQVGLGNIENYAIATKELAELGESNTSYMTPLRVKEAIDVLAIPLLTDHLNDFDNPHMVTATQVGAPTVDEMNAVLALKLDSDATAVNATRAYGLTLNELALEVLKGTAANSLLFEGKTLQEVITETLSGKAGDSTLFNGMDIDEVMNYIAVNIGDLGTVEVVAKDTERFNGLTFEEARDQLLDGTATNASNFGGIPFADFFTYILNLLENEILLDFNVTNSNKLENLSLSEVLDLAREQISEDSKRFDGLTREEFIDSLADVELGNARTLAGKELDDLSEVLMSMVTRDYGLGYHRSFSINLGAVTTTDRWIAVGKSLFRETSPGAANRQVGVVEVEFSFKDTTNNHGSPVKYQFFVEGKSIKGYLLNDSLKDEVEVSTTLSDHLYFSQTTSELNEDDVYENTILSEVNEDTGSVVSNVILYLEISDELKSLMLNNELVVKTSTWGGVFNVGNVEGELLSSLPIGSDTSTFGSIGISGVENTSTLPSEIILGLTDIPPHGVVPLPTLDLSEYELRAYLPNGGFSGLNVVRETNDVVFLQQRDLFQPDVESTMAMNKSSKHLSVYIVAVRLNNNGLLSNIMEDYGSSGRSEDKLADHSIITVEPDVSSRDVKIYANPGCVMRISYERATGGLRHYAVIISDRTNNTSLGTRESATEFSNINSCRYVHISDALVGSVVTIRIYGNTALIPVGPSNGRIYKDSHEFYVSGNIKTVPHLSTLNNLKHFAFKADNDFTITNSLPATVDSLELTFANCPYFNSGNISQWDTSFVKSFEKCFYNARNFNQNLSNWVTSGAVLRPYAFDTNALAWDPANKPTFTPFSALGAAIEDLDFSDQG